MTAQIKKALAQAEAKAWMEANRGWDKGLPFRPLFSKEEGFLNEEIRDQWSQPVTILEVLTGQVR
jgi:hypothetical protein